MPCLTLKIGLFYLHIHLHKNVLLFVHVDAVKDTALGSRQLIIFVFTAVIMLPLSLYKDVGKISKASLLSLVFIGFIVITLLVKAVLLYGQL